MGHKRLWRILLATSVAVLIVFALIIGAAAGGRTLTATMTGDAEVPGPGDPDATGFATLTFNRGQGEVCFDITVENIESITAGHIHVGTADVAGPVVVPLITAPTAPDELSGCVEADRALIKAITKTPSDYYVNLHNEDFPAGALRGQLSK